MLKKEVKNLVSFIESSKGFDNNAKLKLILFSAGIKPNTYVSLRISTKNLDEKYHFEQHLKKAGFLSQISRPKTYEEIEKISKNKSIWNIKGTWYGYDLFNNRKSQRLFQKYFSLVKKQQHDKADLIAGKLYGYPKCCINRFIEEHDLKQLAKKYSYYNFYNRLHTLDKKFPFLSHTSCSLKCKDSIRLNNNYKSIVKKIAPRFWKEYTKKQSFTTKLVVDAESDIFLDKINESRSIWSKKDGHDYSLIALTKFKRHHYVFSYLSKKNYQRGTILLANVIVQYDYAIIKIKNIVGLLNNFHHQRKLLGKK